MFKNDSFISKRDLALRKTETFYYRFHNYPLGEAGLADWTDIANLDITDEGPAGKRRLVTYKAIKMQVFLLEVLLYFN